jgi:extradiol dioxygenase family protein
MAILKGEDAPPMKTHLPTPHYPRFHLAFPVTDLGQATMFLLDPFGNAFEFKAFADIGLLFAKNP